MHPSPFFSIPMDFRRPALRMGRNEKCDRYAQPRVSGWVVAGTPVEVSGDSSVAVMIYVVYMSLKSS